jgi:two-component system NarL family sensor kinase
VRYAKNPVAQFLAAGLVVLVVVVVGTLQLSRRAAADEALNDARATTELLARSVAQPALPPGLVDVDPGAVDQFDRTVLSRLLVGDVQRIKIWRPDGTIVYSDQTQLIGNRFPLGDEELEILENGGSEAEISDLNEPENRFEDKNSGGLLEVYTRIESPDKQPLLFEAYYSLTDIAERRQQVYDAFQPIALGGLLVLVAVTTPLLWALTRRLERTSRDRTRLLEVAADASENERRRIARDLHDGVVQDLAGTSFALSATMRDPATDSAVAQRLEPMAGSLRSSLRSLRSLLVEIYPPDLDVEGLNAALHDLVAPAASMGVEPVVEVYDVEGASDDSIRLVWRVAQEAVRNSLRHAHAQHLTVQVGRHGDRLTLDVTDDGQGFVTGGPGAAAGNNRANGTVNGSAVNGAVDPAGGSGGLGLRSLRDLIAEAGGRLDVRSTPGEGTTVHLEVAR